MMCDQSGASYIGVMDDKASKYVLEGISLTFARRVSGRLLYQDPQTLELTSPMAIALK